MWYQEQMKIIPYKQHNHIGYCVYFLYDKSEIVYIGYTFNLGKRLGEHSQWINSRENHRNELIKKQFTHYSIIPMNIIIGYLLVKNMYVIK